MRTDTGSQVPGVLSQRGQEFFFCEALNTTGGQVLDEAGSLRDRLIYPPSGPWSRSLYSAFSIPRGRGRVLGAELPGAFEQKPTLGFHQHPTTGKPAGPEPQANALPGSGPLVWRGCGAARPISGLTPLLGRMTDARDGLSVAVSNQR